MAFGRLQRTPGAQPMSDINMTPLIDVMLVLLVIFMITAPLMTSSLKLDLPKTEAGEPNDAPQSVSVALDPQGRYYVGDEIVDAATFSSRMAAAARNNPQTEVQLRADRSVPYGRVAELIAIVQKAGLTRIGFVTDPETTAGDGVAQTPAAGTTATAPKTDSPKTDSPKPMAPTRSPNATPPITAPSVTSRPPAAPQVPPTR